MRRLLPLLFLLLVMAPPPASAQTAKPRARDLGLSTQIGGTAGTLDAITDVPGVEVGHTTLISGNGVLVVGQGPVAPASPSSTREARTIPTR